MFGKYEFMAPLNMLLSQDHIIIITLIGMSQCYP